MQLMKILNFLLLLCAGVGSACASASSEKLTEESLLEGARVAAPLYAKRCILCHGKEGYGDGRWAIKLAEYPKINLMVDINAHTREGVRAAIFYGGSTGVLSSHMPPSGEELSSKEVDALTDLVLLLRISHFRAEELIQKEYNKLPPSLDLGDEVFASHCTLCHGKTGKGDGRMSRILKNPPPFNLTKSSGPASEILKIITLGGEGVGRDSHMPPWRDQLTERDINSLVLYLFSLREH